MGAGNHPPAKAFNDALHRSEVAESTTWLCLAVFFPVHQPQAYEKEIFSQFSLPIRTGGCTASSKRYKKPCTQGGEKGINKILQGHTQGQEQLSGEWLCHHAMQLQGLIAKATNEGKCSTGSWTAARAEFGLWSVLTALTGLFLQKKPTHQCQNKEMVL